MGSFNKLQQFEIGMAVFYMMWIGGLRLTSISIIGIFMLLALVTLSARCQIRWLVCIFGLITGGYIFITSLGNLPSTYNDQYLFVAIDCLIGLINCLYYFIYGYKAYKSYKDSHK